jgi:hypothetical protein
MNVVTTNGVMQEPNNFFGLISSTPIDDNNQEMQQNSIIK